MTEPRRRSRSAACRRGFAALQVKGGSVRTEILEVARRTEDLYALLGLSAGAPAAQLRKAYEWAMQVERSPARRAEIQQAYAVLGDPRLRSEYDRGRTVGVGVQQLYQRPTRAAVERPVHRDVVAASSCSSPAVDRSAIWAAGLGLVLTLVAAASYIRPLVAGASSSDASGSAQLAALHRPAAPIGLATGVCLSGQGGTISPSQAVDCAQPHRFEVIKVIDLDQLLGRPFTDADRAAAGDACSAEFRAFIGLAGTAGPLFSAGMLDLAPAGSGSSFNICLVGSQQPRAGSAAHLAR